MKPARGSIAYGCETISYEVRRVDNRKTLGIEVHPDLRVLVRAPADTDTQTIEERVRRRARWISRQLRHFDRYGPRTRPRHYVAGETHLYLGRPLRLKVVAGEKNNVIASRGALSVTCSNGISQKKVKSLLQAWYSARAGEVFDDVMTGCFRPFGRMGHKPPRLAVRAMKTRWGSLSAKGTMTLNSNLVKAPRPCIEYVIVHELCHLVHKDHGTGFYRLLERLMPDWRRRKQRLEEALS